MAKCSDTRPCFAKKIAENAKAFNRCSILVEGYEKDGECPFCKSERDYDPPDEDYVG